LLYYFGGVFVRLDEQSLHECVSLCLTGEYSNLQLLNKLVSPQTKGENESKQQMWNIPFSSVREALGWKPYKFDMASTSAERKIELLSERIENLRRQLIYIGLFGRITGVQLNIIADCV
jgi:hypothetical protein